MTSLSARFAFFKIALLSSSFLLIAIHARIPAIVWPNTGRPKMWDVALVVQHPLKILSQNFANSILRTTFFSFWWIWNSKILPDIVWWAFYLLDADIVSYIFYVCHFLLSSKKKNQNHRRVRTHLYSNSRTLIIFTNSSHCTNSVFLDSVTIGILLHASRFGTIRRFWRLAIRDSDNPSRRAVAVALSRDAVFDVD